MTLDKNKLLWILTGAIVFCLASMLVLPNAWALVTGKDVVAMWHMPFFFISWGVGGWIAGRQLPRHGLVSGFMAGSLGSLFVATLSLVSPIYSEAFLPLAFLAAVAILIATVGGWLGGISAKEPAWIDQ